MNNVHPTAVIGPHVKLGTGNIVGPYAVIIGPCEVGDDNWIGPHVTIGGPPEIRGVPHRAGWDDPDDSPGISIGSRNILREFTCVDQPSAGRTTIGDDCYIMNRVYIAHDSVICDRATISASVSIGGHVHVGAHANLGLGCTVHQRRTIGPGAMLGMGTVVTRDVPPFVVAFGVPVRVRGVNRVGMERIGISATTVDELARRYAADDLDLDPDDVPGELADAFAWWRGNARRG